ncbi:MAG: sigma 54-interacting transcriptional regulator [Acidobacteria bacterium]|nr:sigma 54-interacting transcriptional regulator [Acidobacteriota bacterium]
MRRILLAWLGMADLAAASGERDELGPIASAASAEQFREIVLLSNYTARENSSYVAFLGEYTQVPVRVERRDLKNDQVIDHGAIYEATRPVIDAVYDRHGREASLVYHLSPGTPAMAAVWVLLGKSTHPADLIQTSPRKAGFQVASIPFSVSADFRSVLRDDCLADLLSGAVPQTPEARRIIGECDGINEAKALAARVAPRRYSVLIVGESGTGKELFASLIHSLSGSSREMVRVNAGGIPESLLESQLFGYKRGAFTGADRDTLGFFHAARDSSIFLDEIGELSGDAQVRLLRVLQDREFYRVGSATPEETSARVIAATNRDLRREVERGTFREDLFFRFSFFIQLPPLRERGVEDVDLLIDHFLGQLNREFRRGSEPGATEKVLSPQARSLLRSHTWPGNARELQNTLVRAGLFSSGEEIAAQDVHRALHQFAGPSKDLSNRPLGPDFQLKTTLHDIERRYIRRALEATPSQNAAAAVLGLESGSALRYRIKVLGMKS